MCTDHHHPRFRRFLTQDPTMNYRQQGGDNIHEPGEETGIQIQDYADVHADHCNSQCLDEMSLGSNAGSSPSSTSNYMDMEGYNAAIHTDHSQRSSSFFEHSQCLNEASAAPSPPPVSDSSNCDSSPRSCSAATGEHYYYQQLTGLDSPDEWTSIHQQPISDEV